MKQAEKHLNLPDRVATLTSYFSDPNCFFTPSPGEILLMELEARNWSQRQFATIIDKPVQAINELIHAKKQIIPETALRIAAALGTSPELWINLEADYRLSLARQTVSPQMLLEIGERSSNLAIA